MAWFLHPELRFFRTEIEAAANKTNLDPGLIAAVVLTESSGITSAYRYEPLFWQRYHLGEQPAYRGQNPRRWSASYGLLQILATTAQELGHTGVPEALFQPTVGLAYGCQHLRRCLDWAQQFTQASDKDRLLAGLAAYNGGRTSAQHPPTPRNLAYSLRVLDHMAKLA